MDHNNIFATGKRAKGLNAGNLGEWDWQLWHVHQLSLGRPGGIGAQHTPK